MKDPKDPVLKHVWYWLWNLEYPSGWTNKAAKKFLRENTHCGKYWNAKPFTNVFDGTVNIYMPGNEHVSIKLDTGEINKTSFDY